MSKKVVRVESASKDDADSTWKPSEGANSKATLLRAFAFLLWLVAIGGEAVGIFVLLEQDPVNMALLIGLIVVIGILAIAGNLLWKKANRLDPARKSDPIRFFFQNQLGAIITLIAFVPLIVLILLDKDMSKGQKALAGGIGIVVALIATATGVSLDPPSVEQYTAETNAVKEATGQDLVYWTKHGEVFHVCDKVSDLQHDSEDDTIYSGTVADAHAAGKERLTKKIDLELRQCGLAPDADVPGATIAP